MNKQSRKIKNLSKKARKIKKKSKLYGGVNYTIEYLKPQNKEECNNYRNQFKYHDIYWDKGEQKCFRIKQLDEQT